LKSELFPKRTHVSALSGFAIPIVTVQVGISLMGTVDALMVGRVSAADLAAVALGHLYFMTVSSFGTGTLLALDTVISQAVGSGKKKRIDLGIQRGLLLTIPLSLITGVLLLPAQDLFVLLRQPTETIPMASGYAIASIGGILPLYGFLVLRQSLQCLGAFSPIVWAVVIGNTTNIVLNWIFVFGHLGAPEMGAVGAGWATAAGRWVMAFVVLKRGWFWLETHLGSFRKEVSDRVKMLQIIRIGCPIGIQTTLEYGVFAVIGLLVGLFGTIAMASHQIAISLASSTFMIAVGIAQATTVLVGRAVGSKDIPTARRFAGAGLLNVSVVMATTGLIFFFFPEFMAQLYTDDLSVIVLATTLIPIAGIFQIVDGLQAVTSGILRGIGDTLIPMGINLVGFWLIGLPISAYLGFGLDMASAGLWWGMVVALAVVCSFLMLRLKGHFLRD
jgi:MATE family multidrug resistance protein